MKKYALLLVLSFAINAHAQTDSLIQKLDSLEQRNDSLDSDPRLQVYTKENRIHFNTYFQLLASNFQQQVSYPFKASGKDWIKVGKFALIAGALSFADVPLQRRALRFNRSSETVQKVSKFVTDFGGQYETYTLATLGTIGFVFKKERMKTTTLLATQSYITAGTIVTALKYITGRQRPNWYGNDSIPARATFHGPFTALGRSYEGARRSPAFPSGHTAIAFAAATVFALQYPDKKWVQIVSYSAATLVGASRVTENKHWATDVLVGAAIGYLSGRQVVNNFHRYSQLKRSNKRKPTLSFSMRHQFGAVAPVLILHL